MSEDQKEYKFQTNSIEFLRETCRDFQEYEFKIAGELSAAAQHLANVVAMMEGKK